VCKGTCALAPSGSKYACYHAAPWQVLQADGGTRCAAINAAVLALADAGVPLRDLAGACAAGEGGGTSLGGQGIASVYTAGVLLTSWSVVGSQPPYRHVDNRRA
jgi:hypothetical protein